LLGKTSTKFSVPHYSCNIHLFVHVHILLVFMQNYHRISFIAVNIIYYYQQSHHCYLSFDD